MNPLTFTIWVAPNGTSGNLHYTEGDLTHIARHSEGANVMPFVGEIPFDAHPNLKAFFARNRSATARFILTMVVNADAAEKRRERFIETVLSQLPRGVEHVITQADVELWWLREWESEIELDAGTVMASGEEAKACVS